MTMKAIRGLVIALIVLYAIAAARICTKTADEIVDVMKRLNQQAKA